MNHRRMIRYRRHRGYGASALSFVTACWNGLWKETLFSVSSVSSVVSLLLCLFFPYLVLAFLYFMCILYIKNQFFKRFKFH